MQIHTRFTINLMLVLSIMFTANCVPERESLIKRKLEVIAEDDLKTVIDEIKENGIADSTYYTITTYKKYKQGKFSFLAIIDFHFLKDVKVKMVRKYRYHTDFKKWDRYYNEYQYLSK